MLQHTIKFENFSKFSSYFLLSFLSLLLSARARSISLILARYTFLFLCVCFGSECVLLEAERAHIDTCTWTYTHTLKSSQIYFEKASSNGALHIKERDIKRNWERDERKKGIEMEIKKKKKWKIFSLCLCEFRTCFVTYIRHSMDVKVLLGWMVRKANCFDVCVRVAKIVATKILIFFNSLNANENIGKKVTIVFDCLNRICFRSRPTRTE